MGPRYEVKSVTRLGGMGMLDLCFEVWRIYAVKGWRGYLKEERVMVARIPDNRSDAKLIALRLKEHLEDNGNQATGFDYVEPPQ